METERSGERERRGNVGKEVEEREKKREARNAPLPAAAPAERRACRQLRHARRLACSLFAGGLVMGWNMVTSTGMATGCWNHLWPCSWPRGKRG